jgi:hypothetical protein
MISVIPNWKKTIYLLISLLFLFLLNCTSTFKMINSQGNLTFDDIRFNFVMSKDSLFNRLVKILDSDSIKYGISKKECMFIDAFYSDSSAPKGWRKIRWELRAYYTFIISESCEKNSNSMLIMIPKVLIERINPYNEWKKNSDDALFADLTNKVRRNLDILLQQP